MLHHITSPEVLLILVVARIWPRGTRLELPVSGRSLTLYEGELVLRSILASTNLIVSDARICRWSGVA